MNDAQGQNIISATEFARMKGKSKSWGARLAQNSKNNDKPYPQRLGHYWMATYEEWEKALDEWGIQLRNRKKD